MVAMRLYFLFLLIDAVYSIVFGRLQNCTYVTTNALPVILNGTSCISCLCNAFVHSSSFVALNCIENGRQCQLFLNYSTSYSMLSSPNSTFFFYPSLPSIVSSVEASTAISTVDTIKSPTTASITTATSSLRWNSTGSCVAGMAAGTSGVAANQLYYPYDLTLDSNNSLYITDSWNNRIQKYVTGTFTGVTIAGQASGTSGASSSALSMPVGIVLDSTGNMYFTDRSNHRLMYWANGATSGTTIAGTTGTSGSANNQFNGPSGLTRIASSGTLYIADTFNHRIMQYLSGASSGSIVAGGNGAGTTSTQLNFPYSFAFDSSSNSFLIANYGAHNVVRWVLGASSWTLVLGITGSAGSTSTKFNAPLSVTLDPMGNIYIADTNNHRIQFFLAGQSNGSTIAGVTGSSGVSSTRLNTPYWAIVDNELNLFVADTYNHRVQRFQRY